MKFVESVRASLTQVMEDERAQFLGEDVLDPYGGAFKVSAGLSSKYPDRVHTTPISEGAIIGVATGMAMRGLRPVAEIMFGDFLTLCADQIVNHATKFAAMYNGKVKVPMIVRSPVGAGRGYGPTHSQSLEKMFLGTPHLRVIAPSHAHDPGELLAQAYTAGGVTLFLEHKMLYPLELFAGSNLISRKVGAGAFPSVTLCNHDRRSPCDIILVGFGGSSRLFVPALELLAAEEIRASAVLCAEIGAMSGDLLVECRQAERILVVDEASAGFNWSSEVVAFLYDQLVPNLRHPIGRLNSECDIIPTSRAQEEVAIVTTAKIIEKVWGMLK
ncbi:alpha-ketoacid dehydrogenase subunit beta [Devosia alba]|uniref:alpha-ketoacid dehydrogenase subunit beta n=1 Tax=Devosia alba TaxID=3152360 RepID=UPI0032632C0F